MLRAQLDLGYLYEQGKGVPLDHIAAYMWYKLAAAGGERRAVTQLKILSSVMTEAQIRQATSAAAELNIPAPNPSAAAGSASVGISWLPPRQRLRCVLGMLSSLEVKVLWPT